MKLPRDLNADELIRALSKLGYERLRQTGSHIRIRTLFGGEYHETIPCHSPIKTGTLNSILKNIAQHHGMTRDELLRRLDL
jgi:predicted RNA binding protein YcfA (HicA-like mRNA interferase family)